MMTSQGNKYDLLYFQRNSLCNLEKSIEAALQCCIVWVSQRGVFKKDVTVCVF